LHSVLAQESPAQLRAESGLPTATKPSAATITVGGTAAAGTAVVSILGQQITFAVDGSSNTTTAASAVTAINANAALARVLTATNAAGVVSLTPVNADNLLNGLVSSTVSNTSATATLTHVAFGTGGLGVLTPQDNFVVYVNRNTYAVRAGHPILATGALLAAIQGAVTSLGANVI